MKSWTPPVYQPAHWPTADMRNRSYDRRRTALRMAIAGAAAFGLGWVLVWAIFN